MQVTTKSCEMNCPPNLVLEAVLDLLVAPLPGGQVLWRTFGPVLRDPIQRLGRLIVALVKIRPWVTPSCIHTWDS